jgi:hypothetical protein
MGPGHTKLIRAIAIAWTGLAVGWLLQLSATHAVGGLHSFIWVLYALQIVTHIAVARMRRDGGLGSSHRGIGNIRVLAIIVPVVLVTGIYVLIAVGGIAALVAPHDSHQTVAGTAAISCIVVMLFVFVYGLGVLLEESYPANVIRFFRVPCVAAVPALVVVAVHMRLTSPETEDLAMLAACLWPVPLVLSQRATPPPLPTAHVVD